MSSTDFSSYTLQILSLASTFGTALAVIISAYVTKAEAARSTRKAEEVKTQLVKSTDDLKAVTTSSIDDVKIQLVKSTKDLTAATTGSTQEVKDQLDVIHKLVNSSMLEQKRLTMLALVRVSDLTGDAKDKALADDAIKIYQTHKDAQDKQAAA